MPGLTRPLILIPWSPALPGGVSVVVRRLATLWPDALTVVNDWTARTPATDAAGELHYRFSWPAATGGAGLLRSLLAAPAWLLRTLRFLRAQRAGAIHAHYPTLDLLGLAALRRLRLTDARLVLCFHGSDVRAPQSAREARLYRWLLGSSDAVCACSQALAERIAQCWGHPADRVAVVHNGVDTQLFRPPGDGDVPPPGLPAVYAASIGSYIPRKGHALLLDAFAGVAARLPQLGLVFAGMDGPERAPLLQRAAVLGLLPRVQCLVALPPQEVAAVLRHAAVCVQPSRSEPFGLAVIEAGASGVPVIATAVEGHAEIVADGRTGRLFAVGDVEGCSALLAAQIDQPQPGIARAERFRREIADRYTWQRCADGYAAAAAT